jgi:hypothetical protein
MRKASRESAQLDAVGPVADRHADLDGGYTVNFITFGADLDATEMMKGLVNDQCQCPHWGYVFKGRITFRSAEGEETFGPGDAFYLQPGHIPIVAAGTEYLQFSPSAELHEVSAHLVAKASQMQGAPSA